MTRETWIIKRERFRRKIIRQSYVSPFAALENKPKTLRSEFFSILLEETLLLLQRVRVQVQSPAEPRKALTAIELLSRQSRPFRLSQALAIAAESLMDNVGEIQEGTMIYSNQHGGAAVTLAEIDWCLCLKLTTESGPSCEVQPSR